MARLLIVDNDERIVELSAWFMRRLGHQVETANSYAEARLVLNETWPDLMLADLDLGYERGQEELPKLANEGRLPATLVVSGFLDAELDSALRRIPGVLGTVAKPVDLKHLEGLIRQHLETGQRIPAPASVASTPEAESPQEQEDADGWVEIAPLAPGIDPAPPIKRSPWGDPGPAVGVGNSEARADVYRSSGPDAQPGPTHPNGGAGAAPAPQTRKLPSGAGDNGVSPMSNPARPENGTATPGTQASAATPSRQPSHQPGRQPWR